MKLKFIPKLLTGVLAIVALASCGGPTCIKEGRNPDVDFENTPYTDALKIGHTYEELAAAHFAYGENSGYDTGDGYGLVDLRSCTDGDTANFIQAGYNHPVTRVPISLKTRFNGIDTPESTAKVQPWGKKASRFTKHKLEAAQANADAETQKTGKKVYNIALVTDEVKFGYKETNGRWLAFVWYRPTVNDDFRNLCLEIVEQGYSKNRLYKDSDLCPYRKSFEAADAVNAECGYRVYGEVDKDYSPEKETYEATLWDVVNHYEEYGSMDEEGTSGKKVHILAQVVGIQGDNVFLRDVIRPDEQDPLSPLQTLYGYAGFDNAGLCGSLVAQCPDTDGIGAIIYFYARATIHFGNMQLTDISSKQYGPNKLQFVDESNCEEVTGRPYHELTIDTSNKYYAPEELNTKEKLGSHQYEWISTDIELRTVTPYSDDDKDRAYNPLAAEVKDERYWFREADNGSITYYAKIAGTNIPFNLRCDGKISPSISPSYFDSNVGNDELFNVEDALNKVYHVTGFVVAYFENFQLTIPNNYPSQNYIYPVTNA